MKNDKILNYFKNYILFQIIGAGVLAVGFLIWWYAWEIWFLGSPIMLVGAVLLIVGGVLKVTDDAYSENITGKLKYEIKYVEGKPYFVSDGYITDGTVYAKIDKNGILRTEKFAHTELYINKNDIDVYMYTVNVAEDKVECLTERFSLEDTNAEIKTTECKASMKEPSKTKKQSVLTITEGEKKVTFPINANDIKTDELVSKINEKQ